MSAGFMALDIIVQGERISHAAGGTAANVAANLAYLGWDAAIAGRVGDDEGAVRFCNDLRGSGVDLSSLRSEPGVSTAMVVHAITENGHAFRFSCPHCGRRLPRHRPLPIGAAEAVALTTPSPDVFFFDRATPFTVELARRYRSSGALVFFEPSRLGREGNFRAALDTAHVVKISGERQSSLNEALRHEPAEQVRIVTLGALGARLRQGDSGWQVMPAFAARVRDTGGAGDWMTAGFLAALSTLDPGRLKLADLVVAAQGGEALAALSCSFFGARGLSEGMSAEAAISRRDAILAGAPMEAVDLDLSRDLRQVGVCGGCLVAA